MLQVLKARPKGDLSSTGNGSLVLMAQEDFPYTYDQRDEIQGVDHDRVYERDFSHAQRVIGEHIDKGSTSIGSWVQKHGKEKVIAFLADYMKVPREGWTGYRVLGTVNRSNGFPVWSLELFKKHPDSKTKVYSGRDAPNVEGYGKPKSRRYGPFGHYWED